MTRPESATSSDEAQRQTVDADQPGSVGSGYFRYQGRLDVSPTGSALYDMSARFYAPGLGAFTGLDTYGGEAANPLSMNRFLYAEANPATFIDPTGHGVDCGIGMSCTTEERQAERRRQQNHGGSGGNGGSGGSTATTNSTANTVPSISTGAPAACPMCHQAPTQTIPARYGYALGPSPSPSATISPDLAGGIKIDPNDPDSYEHLAKREPMRQGKSPNYVDKEAWDRATEGLTDEEERFLHDEISGQGLTEEKIKQEAEELKRLRPQPEPGPSIPSPEEFDATHPDSSLDHLLEGFGYGIVYTGGAFGFGVVAVGVFVAPEVAIPTIAAGWRVLRLAGP